MSFLKRRAVRSAQLGLVLTLALAGASRADYLEAFKNGIRAKNFKDWRQVAAAMRQAIAEQPRATGEGVRIYGMEHEPYIPHYFLGIALYRQNDCAGAAQAFDEAAAQGSVRGIYRGRLEFFRDVCDHRLGRQRPATTATRISSGTRPTPSPVPSPNAGQSTQVRPTPPSPSDPATPAPAPGTVRQKALEDMVREAREWIARGESLTRRLQTRRRADPQSAEILMVAEQRLQAAAFQLEGCRREGDLEGAERARDDAQATCEILDDLVKGL